MRAVQTRNGAIDVVNVSPSDGPGVRVHVRSAGICGSDLHLIDAPEAGRDIDYAAALLAIHPDIADTLITHRFPLDAAVEAFTNAAARSAGAIKVILEP